MSDKRALLSTGFEEDDGPFDPKDGGGGAGGGGGGIILQKQSKFNEDLLNVPYYSVRGVLIKTMSLYLS